MLKPYIASLYAEKGEDFCHGAVGVLAADERAAEEEALRLIHRANPSSAGWSGHAVLVGPLEFHAVIAGSSTQLKVVKK
jgi:hypothetical protein